MMKTISFFSYKGGSGRSSALVNTVPFLVKELGADQEHPIILLDMDVDSTGLTYLLHQGDKVGNGSTLSIQKIMIDGVPGGNNFKYRLEEHPFFSSLLKVGSEFRCENGSVLLLPAEAGSAVGANGTNKSMTNRDSTHIEKIMDICERYDCAALIFDSSAGDQDTANISNSKADVIVCCMRPTIQFQEGTLDYFKRMSRIIRNRDVILMPNAVSRDKIEVDGKMYPITAKNRIVEAFDKGFPETGNTIHYDAMEGSNFGIPFVKRFLWQEAILAALDQANLTEDEKEALTMYQKVAEMVNKYSQKGNNV